jgi:hypothetical protein
VAWYAFIFKSYWIRLERFSTFIYIPIKNYSFINDEDISHSPGTICRYHPIDSLPVLLLSGISTGLGAPFVVNFVVGSRARRKGLRLVVGMIIVTSLAVPFTLPSFVYLLFHQHFQKDTTTKIIADIVIRTKMLHSHLLQLKTIGDHYILCCYFTIIMVYQQQLVASSVIQ